MTIRPFVDSHVHFWDPDHLDYDWLAHLPQIRRTYQPKDLIDEAGAVMPDRMVFVQADCANDQAVEEVAWITALARSEPRIQAIVAYAPLEKGPAAKPLLETLRLYPLVRGIRRLIQSEKPGFCRSPHLAQGIQMLADYGFSFDLGLRHHQIGEAVDLVARCPEIPFVLDHGGKPDIKGGELDEWSSNISRIATHRNVHCKLSGLVTEADWQGWTPQQLQPFVDRLLHSFGPDRLMFGGDWPVVTLASSYPRWAETALTLIDRLTDEEKRKIMAENAIKFYRL